MLRRRFHDGTMSASKCRQSGSTRGGRQHLGAAKPPEVIERKKNKQHTKIYFDYLSLEKK